MLRRSTRSTKKLSSPERHSNVTESSVEEFKNKKEQRKHDSGHSKARKGPKSLKSRGDTSSSESDIEDYLQPIDKIDLNSSFFKVEVPAEGVSPVEKHRLLGIRASRLSDSDTSSEDETKVAKSAASPTEPNVQEVAKVNEDEETQLIKEGEQAAKLIFHQLQEYTRKFEEAKKSIEQYNEKNSKIDVKEIIQPEKINIDSLLTAGESKLNENKSLKTNPLISSALNSSSYETYSDSEEDWEEIKSQQENQQKSLLPQKELEITVEMPQVMRKKKGIDLLTAVKRRLNRKRKENQVLIHKVHLLCWIAHGNYVNSILSDQDMMALGLSLIPSEKCYPSGRIDLGYLEQILKWYKKTISLSDRLPSKHKSLNQLLTEQIEKKVAYTKKMLVLIFIIILRSLGIQCRLVLSFQVEPLRPPNSDLHYTGSGNGASSKGQSKIKESVDSKSTSPSVASSHVEEKKKKISEDLSKKVEIPNKTKQLGSSSSKHNFRDNEKTKSPKKSDSSKISKDARVTVSGKNPSKVNHEKKSTKSEARSKENNIDVRHKDKIKGTKEKTSKLKDSQNNIEQFKYKKTKPEVSKNVDTKFESSNSRSSRSKSKISAEAESNTRSKSANVLYVKLEKIDVNCKKNRSKSTNSPSGGLKLSKKDRIMQLDGSDDALEEFKGFKNQGSQNVSFENFYSKMYNKISDSIETKRMKLHQLDGASDEPSKPNFKKLKVDHSDIHRKSTKHKRNSKKPNYVDRTTSDSDDCFEESPSKKPRTSTSQSSSHSNEDVAKKRKPSVNLKKLQQVKSKTITNLHNPTSKQADVTNDIMNLIKGRISEQKQIDRMRIAKNRKTVTHDSDSDSDYVPEAALKKYHSDSDNEFHPKLKVKQRVQVKKQVEKVKTLKKPRDPNNRKAISSDSEYTEEEIEKDQTKVVKAKKGNDTWLEVFLETEEKWISVDVIFGQVHCVNELYSRASHPVSYVIGWYNNNYLKDITRRYNQNYNTVTRKLRVDAQWWDATLKPFLGPKTAMEKEEDDELNRQQMEKPLPTTISEYKNHPLYALERHLLKFEALYPPNAPPIGFVRKEPVYSRDCVYICHSRDIWLKQAKTVKLGEKPYKIVKARPKYDRLSNKMITDQLLEIFGPWQVEDYTPPTAENGIVPRNAFGNVDLFKPTMLPKKCVHLQLPGLNKIARRMNIDCAAAIVGFDFHGGWSHPVYDGFVVCEEFEPQLVAAWNIEQEEIEKKEQEKYEKRVYGNWKKLIRGLRIRERLKARYGFGANDADASTSGKNKKHKLKVTKRRIISDTSSSDEDEK